MRRRNGIAYTALNTAAVDGDTLAARTRIAENEIQMTPIVAPRRIIGEA
jgi:hypothetical protein